jgi:hypothetical protein
MRALAVLLMSSLPLLVGCPDAAKTVSPSPAGASTPPPVVDKPPAPAPREGWGVLGVGSSFETVMKGHLGDTDFERTTVQTVVGVDPDGVRVKTELSGGGVDDPPPEPTKYLFKQDEKDPDARKPETVHETVTVKAGTFECDRTTETQDGVTTKTWRTKEFPVPVKIEVTGGVSSVTELVRADVKKP